MSATFERWLEFVFNNPVSERRWYWGENFDSQWDALELTDAVIVRHLTRLFLEPGVLRSYSLDQVEQGLWFLLAESSPGCPSMALLRRKAAMLDRVTCIHAVSRFFCHFILDVTPRHFDPQEPSTGVTGVAYMWWDIFPMHFYMRSHVIERSRPSPALPLLEKLKLGSELHEAVLELMAEELKIEIEAEVHEATLSVMAEVLDLPSETCQFSALHGLGHWHASHPKRVKEIIYTFLARHRDL